MKRYLTLGALAALAATPAVVDAKTTTRTYTTTLTGAAESPGPGDPNGRGSAVIKVRGAKLCYDIKLRNVAGSAAAHIHEGTKGKAGDVLIALYGNQSTAKRRKGCVEPGADKLRRLRADPRGFYVNVHNAEYPNGAVRGQLKKR